jgi:hypothetical protein
LNVARWAAVAVFLAAIATGVFFLALGYGDDSFLLGGIQVNEADHEQWFEALGRAGMNTVAATVYAKQGDWDTDHLWWEDQEPSVVQEIRGAKSRGLKVVLIPRVALDHAFPRNRFLWHGLILPRSDELIESWFESYGKFLVKWGEIAEREGVDVFAVGSEMNALASTGPLAALPPLEEYYLDREKQVAKKEAYLETGGSIDAGSLVVRGGERFESLESFLEAETSAHEAWADQAAFGLEGDALARLNERRRLLDGLWRRTIDAVRVVYDGPLTYAANFDQYHDVGFWPALDMIGINAYFPLRSPADPAENREQLYDTLERGWSAILSDLDAFRRDREIPDAPVLFTEIGYVRRSDTTLAPWAGDGMTLVDSGDHQRLVVWNRQPEDFTERALAMRALHAAHAETGGEILRGLLYWKLSTEPAHLEVEPFVHILGSGDDPLADELRRFRKPRPLQRLIAP